MTEASIEGSGN